MACYLQPRYPIDGQKPELVLTTSDDSGAREGVTVGGETAALYSDILTVGSKVEMSEDMRLSLGRPEFRTMKAGEKERPAVCSGENERK